MKFQTGFSPPRGKGTVLYLGLTLLLLGISGALLIFALDQQTSGFFLLALLGAILVLTLIPFILYAVFSLRRARYILDREGLKIRWGLRSLDIPMPDIDWVRLASEHQKDLPMPAWRFSGLLRGLVHGRDGNDVEYLASDQDRLVLVGTSKRVYAISPEIPGDFLKAFQSAFELGSITPLKPISSQAGTFFSSVFSDRAARTKILMDLFLLAALLVTVSILISSRQTVLFGYQTMGLKIEPAPSDRLLILPALSFFTLVADFSVGFFFYRNQLTRQLSYLTLASGVITPLLLFLALLFIQ
jgi:hypothetical protein